jgi:hypothetical protein
MGMVYCETMAIENAGSNEARTLGAWILAAITAITFYLGIDKLRRSGPVKELGERMDKLEENVKVKFEALTNQRTLDVDTLKGRSVIGEGGLGWFSCTNGCPKRNARSHLEAHGS